MNKLSLSKILDILAMIAIVVIFAVYIFKKPAFEITAISLIVIAILKMVASMLKASYFGRLYNETKQENDILKTKIEYLEKGIDREKKRNNN